MMGDLPEPKQELAQLIISVMKAVYLALEAVSTALLVHKFLCLDQNRGKCPMGLNLPGNAVGRNIC